MLEAAVLKSGDRALDIAAGTGAQSLLAAQIVEPQGTVLATDISEAMLKVAKMAVQQAGLTNITTHVMDAEHLTLPNQSFADFLQKHHRPLADLITGRFL